MDLFLSPSFLDHCYCLQFKELILLFIFFFQLGYYFGKKSNQQSLQFANYQTEASQLALSYEKLSQKSQLQQDSLPSNVQHSLKLIKQRQKLSEIASQRLIKSQAEIQLQNANSSKTQDQLSRDILSQKIKIQGKKIQSRGIFHMTFQKAQNPKFVRKIQKHQIITDYEIPQQNIANNQIIPFGSKKFFEFADQSSILEINTYQNLKLNKFPLIQKKLIKTNQFSKYSQKNKSNIPMSPSLCQNGKFNKFFKNPKKIGEGAFGIVYSVKNIFQGKQYAIKKLFIKNGLGQNKMQTVLNQSIKQVSIISQYSHPNIIRFHTCWLQIANLNQAISFNTQHFKSYNVEQQLSENQNYSQLNSDKQFNFKKKKNIQSCVQVSYVSSQANSGFTFDHQSKKNISRSPSRISAPIQNSQCHIVSCIQTQKQENKQNQKILQQVIPVFALYIQMQLCPEGSLDMYLKRRKTINRSFAFVVINQLLVGVHYLHQNGLVHRDLKPGNILINKKQKLIKIGDFGLSAQMSQQVQYGKIGTPSYIAPQMLQKRQIRKQQLHLIDVYSIGVIFFQLLNLFNMCTKHQKLQKINNLKQSKIQLHQQFKLQKRLIKLMTKTKNRLSVKQIFQRAEYQQLRRISQQDKQISKSWQNISGLQTDQVQN